MNKGLVHLYCGQGKGKTTAAMGLALRALGQGMQVVVIQFLKTGTSGELEPLRRLGAVVRSGKPGAKFTFQMNAAEKTQAAAENNERLREALTLPCDLMILDEICAARQSGLLDETLAKQWCSRAGNRSSGCWMRPITSQRCRLCGTPMFRASRPERGSNSDDAYEACGH